MELTGFVISVLSVRLIFPAVNLGGEAFWIKFFVYGVPILFSLGLFVVSTNLILKVTPLMMALAVATVFWMVPGVVAMRVVWLPSFLIAKRRIPSTPQPAWGVDHYDPLYGAYLGCHSPRGWATNIECLGEG